MSAEVSGCGDFFSGGPFSSHYQIFLKNTLNKDSNLTKHILPKWGFEVASFPHQFYIYISKIALLIAIADVGLIIMYINVLFCLIMSCAYFPYISFMFSGSKYNDLKVINVLMALIN